MKNTDKKKKNAFLRFLHHTFVKNIGLKISAIFMSVAIWMIITVL